MRLNFGLWRTPLYHLHTVVLFTYSDFKTILFPITLFAAISAPQVVFPALLKAFFWTWMHLLQFCLSNQSLSIAEDARNKPWRPLPASRLSVTEALIFRWCMLPICIYISRLFDVCLVGWILMFGILVHNEMGFQSHWLSRNILNALGYAAFDSGATLICRSGTLETLDSSTITALRVSSLIVLTSIHAQDFQDEAGDRVEGRKTIPIVMPRSGRLSMPIIITLWSVILSMRWKSAIISSLLMIIGPMVGTRFMVLQTPEADKLSYILYNVWLSIARIAPLFVTPDHIYQ